MVRPFFTFNLWHCLLGCFAIGNWFVACVAMALENQATTLPPAFVDVKKSENDSRSYRYLTLNNQLSVLLISDPETEKSAAALNVSVGSYHNPSGREGLAHFLEHLLFLGTEKYPEAGEYQAFIAQHGGSYNAYTAVEDTHYFFDINAAQLEPALDRFAQFFVAPLFTEAYVERERNAVHSEYIAKLKDDARREADVYRDLMNSSHSAARFSVGNLQTLADSEGHSIRDEIIAFYQQYYSAHVMHLVVLGREELDVLERMVKQRFTAIPLRKHAAAEQPVPLFADKVLPASVEIQPEKELRQLTFSFPIPNPDKYYDKKPFDYIAHLLGDEGKGSLLSLLKRLGWAEGITAGVGFKSRDDALFQIALQLTPRGVKAKDQIISLMFYGIEQVQHRGVNLWRYNELQQLADIDFRFYEKPAPIATVSKLAQAMTYYAPEDIVRGDYLYAGFDEKLIRKSLSYLTHDNLLLVLTAPEVEAYRVSTYYAAPFTVRAGIPALLDLKQAVRQELFLPEKNAFIPRRLTVKSKSMLEDAQKPVASAPQIILQNKNMRVWFEQDRVFSQPKAMIKLRIKSPLVAANAEGAAQAQLFAALITDQLEEFTYPAHLAGIYYQLKANTRGFDVSLTGYSSRQSLLLSKIMEVMNRARFDEQRFVMVKADLLRRWRNESKNIPYQLLASKVPMLQYEPYWSNDELIAAVENITLEQFNRFSARQFIDAKLDALFYGNYFKSEALKLSALVEHELLARQTGRDMPPAKLLLLPAKATKPWLYSPQATSPGDNVVELFVQSSSPDVVDAAHMQLIRQIIHPAFFNELRTEKQLGYIVSALPMTIRNLEGTLMVVQSPTTSEALLIKEIDQFVKKQLEFIDDNIAENQRSLVNELLEPARSLSEQADRYWSAIVMYQGNFSRRVDLATALASISSTSLKNYYREHFMQQNRRLWLSSEPLQNSEAFTVIDNIATYKQYMEIIAQP